MRHMWDRTKVVLRLDPDPPSSHASPSTSAEPSPVTPHDTHRTLFNVRETEPFSSGRAHDDERSGSATLLPSTPTLDVPLLNPTPIRAPRPHVVPALEHSLSQEPERPLIRASSLRRSSTAPPPPLLWRPIVLPAGQPGTALAEPYPAKMPFEGFGSELGRHPVMDWRDTFAPPISGPINSHSSATEDASFGHTLGQPASIHSQTSEPLPPHANVGVQQQRFIAPAAMLEVAIQADSAPSLPPPPLSVLPPVQTPAPVVTTHPVLMVDVAIQAPSTCPPSPVHLLGSDHDGEEAFKASAPVVQPPHSPEEPMASHSTGTSLETHPGDPPAPSPPTPTPAPTSAPATATTSDEATRDEASVEPWDFSTSLLDGRASEQVS